MKYPDFASRLSTACDNHELIPPYGYGRQTWLKEKMNVSHEAVRRWVNGESRPRPAKMKELADLLGVDEGWLSLGLAPDVTPREKKDRSVKLAGGANVFMGLLQVGGGHVAFPDPEDDVVDFYAILGGRHMTFHVALAQKASPAQITFVLPPDIKRCTAIGAIRVDPMRLDFVVLPWPVIAQHGVNHGGHIELAVEPRKGHYSVDGVKLTRLQDFESLIAATT